MLSDTRRAFRGLDHHARMHRPGGWIDRQLAGVGAALSIAEPANPGCPQCHRFEEPNLSLAVAPIFPTVGQDCHVLVRPALGTRREPANHQTGGRDSDFSCPRSMSAYLWPTS